jgi:hypothetical protein
MPRRRPKIVERTVLLQEIDSLPSVYWGEVLDFVRYIREKKIGRTLPLEQAAEAAAAEYRAGSDLTDLCALDGEDFYEAR